MSFEIGKTYCGGDFDNVPAGAVFVGKDGKPHITAGPNHPSGFTFEDGQWVSRDEYTLVWLPGNLALTDRRVLAQELLRQRTDDQSRNLEDHFGDEHWLRTADWVLANFVPRDEVPLGVGVKVRLTHQTSLNDHIPVDSEGVIRRELDSDGDFYIEWGTGYDRQFGYAKPNQLERVS